ncbi:hypothetical protein LCGC14_1277640 [marine sediment metagenome]|uniref:PurE domain-containing protein n=1 Tax=marine sediment metagenome TaxID=412755 RepID=A0A0F9LHE8_9ZZZZ
MDDRIHTRFDRNRAGRIGLEEAVLAQFKSADHVAAILTEALDEGRRLLVTRLPPEVERALPAPLRRALDYDALSRTAIIGDMPAPLGAPQIALVSAGTSDAAVAAEARRTLAYSGVASVSLSDVGVAGLWRLLDHLEALRDLPVHLVFAGMDAALPSVLAGQVAGAVIAVPTSVGYGVAEGGRVALDSALASCAPGVTVVNIDNGYGAACAAMRILGAADRIATGRGQSDAMPEPSPSR